MKNIDLIEKTLDVLTDIWGEVDYDNWELKNIHRRIETEEFNDIDEEDFKDLREVINTLDNIMSTLRTKIRMLEDDLPDDYLDKYEWGD